MSNETKAAMAVDINKLIEKCPDLDGSARYALRQAWAMGAKWAYTQRQNEVNQEKEDSKKPWWHKGSLPDLGYDE